MTDKAADDAKNVHDSPDRDDSESPEETLERHEALHHEHRERIDALCKHVGLGEPADDAKGVHDKPDRADGVRRRRRHD